MKNAHKGFIGIAIIILIALTIAGGGVYVYSKKEEVKLENKNKDSTKTKAMTIYHLGSPLPHGTPSPIAQLHDVPSKADEFLRIAPIKNIINIDTLLTLKKNDTVRFELFDGKEIGGIVINIGNVNGGSYVVGELIGEKRYNSFQIWADGNTTSVLIDEPTDELDYITALGSNKQLYLLEKEYGSVGVVE